MKGDLQKIKRKRLEREREREPNVHPCARTSSSGEEPFIYLIFGFRSFLLCLNPQAKPNLFYPTLFTNIY